MKILNDFSHVKYPIITGEVHLINTSVNYSYINVDYTTNSTIVLSKDKIEFPELVLNDKFGNKGVVTGNISHKGFKN